MPIDWKPKRTRNGSPLSFRFSEETALKLRVLSEASNSKQIEIIDALIRDAYVSAEKNRSREIAAAMAKIKRATKTKA